MNSTEMQTRITDALDIAVYGGIDGAHHKMWVIDQMVRALTGCIAPDAVSDEYLDWVTAFNEGEDGPHTYEWDTGIAP